MKTWLAPLSLIAFAAVPNADLLRVGPGEIFTTIQAAVDAASDGDLILVEPGSYPEFRVDGKDLSIVGDAGTFTVLESASPDPAILVQNVAQGQEVLIVGAVISHAVSVNTPKRYSLKLVN